MTETYATGEHREHYADGHTAAYAGQPTSTLYRTAAQAAAYAEGYADGEATRPLARGSAPMSAARLSERTDLRPMAMCARDVRPGMVLVSWRDGARETVLEKGDGHAGQVRTAGDGWQTGDPDRVVQILGEDVLGREVGSNDIIRLSHGWFTAGRILSDERKTYTRAYVDPEWERAQAEQG
jgi:hypothetical protein